LLILFFLLFIYAVPVGVYYIRNKLIF